MFIDDEFWTQFGMPEQPGLAAALAPMFFVLVAPLLVILGAVIWEWLKGE